ncbi:unnamed protein product [Laminaria digitata]
MTKTTTTSTWKTCSRPQPIGGRPHHHHQRQQQQQQVLPLAPPEAVSEAEAWAEQAVISRGVASGSRRSCATTAAAARCEPKRRRPRPLRPSALLQRRARMFQGARRR